MNSSIHLCQNPLAVAPAPGRLSSASRVHASLSRGSLSASQSSKRSHLVSSRLQGFSEWSKMNEERGKKNNIVRGDRGASLAMACSALGAFSLSGKMKPKPILACAAGQGSNPPEDLATGPLKNLLNLRRSFFERKPGDRGSFFERNPGDDEIEALKLCSMALSKNNPEYARDILTKELEHWAKDTQGELVGETAGNLLMALVELLVYQENYDEAREEIGRLRKVVQDNIKPWSKDKKEEGTESEEGPQGTSAFFPAMWNRFFLLKAIVEYVNDARQRLETAGDDTDKPKEELWLIYCRKKKQQGDKPGPTRPGR